MRSVLIDTHTWVWSLQGERKLSSAARSAMLDADAIRISPISFYEIAQKVRLGKWDAMASLAPDLAAVADRNGVLAADLLPSICSTAGMMDWSNRDPFARIIAATARHYGLPLVSADTTFDGIVTRIW